MNIVPESDSPYVGLMPFSIEDARFFVGRETETEMIIANLRSSRLTVLYGASGVGKSSVLQAGVINKLRQLASEDAITYGQAGSAVVIHNKWAGNPLAEISESIKTAVADSIGIDSTLLEPVPNNKSLAETLEIWSLRYGLEIYIILDQFEELFNYIKSSKSPAAIFAEELVQAVRASDLSVRFLFSLRADTLSLLDYFKGKIPRLLDNRLEIKYLKEKEARRAIVEPLDIYNKLYKPAKNYKIKDESPNLADEVIRQVRVGQIIASTGEQNEPAKETPALPAGISESDIETPYLQLVMKRIWREEVSADSHLLRLETLNKIGAAKGIIKAHLNDVIKTLSSDEQRTAAECFKYMVTPMGTKIAYPSEYLAESTNIRKDKIQAVLEILDKGKLSNGGTNQADPATGGQNSNIDYEEARILKPVKIQINNLDQKAYEVRHDALIPAILDWRELYLSKRRRRSTLVKVSLVAAIVITIILATALLVIRNQERQKKQQADEAKIAKRNEQTTKDNYQKLISALFNLAGDSPKEEEAAIKTLTDLSEKKDAIPEELKPEIIKIIDEVNKGVEVEKVSQILYKPNKQNQNTNQNILHSNANINTSQPGNNTNNLSRVYIQILDKLQQIPAEKVQDTLNNQNPQRYNVVGIENVGDINLNSTQIRYFHEADNLIAQNLKTSLESQGVQNIRIQFVSGYANSGSIPSKQMEIWFAADAFSN